MTFYRSEDAEAVPNGECSDHFTKFKIDSSKLVDIQKLPIVSDEIPEIQNVSKGSMTIDFMELRRFELLASSILIED